MRRRRLFSGGERVSESGGHRGPRDPYAGLMSRREREWLLKIQLLQLVTNNPYVDDYYCTMYECRKFAKERQKDGKEGPPPLLVTEKDESDAIGHVYIPRKFCKFVFEITVIL